MRSDGSLRRRNAEVAVNEAVGVARLEAGDWIGEPVVGEKGQQKQQERGVSRMDWIHTCGWRQL